MHQMVTRLLAFALLLAGVTLAAAQFTQPGRCSIGDSGFCSGKASGGGSFNPGQLTGLLLWVEGDSNTFSDSACTTPQSTNGGAVACWKDQSTNGNNLVNAAASNTNPTLSTNALNSLPVLTFNASSFPPFLATGTAQVTLGGTTASCFALALKSTAANNSDRVLNYVANGDANDFGSTTSAIFMFYDTNTDISAFRSSVQRSSGAVTNNTFVQVGSIYDGVNDTTYIANTAQTAVSTTGSFGATGQINMGSVVAGSGNNLDGKVAAAVCTSTAMSSTDRSNLHTYWFNKWATN